VAIDGAGHGLLDLAAGRIAAGMNDAVAGVAALARQFDLAVLPPVELSPPREQALHGLRPAGGHRLDHFGLREAVAHADRVRDVLGDGIVGRQDGGHSALGVEGVRLPGIRLGEHGHLRPRLGGREGG